jgi:hypothetical protein
MLASPEDGTNQYQSWQSYSITSLATASTFCRNGKTERFGGREIDDEIEFRRLLNRKVGWLGPTQNLIDEIASSSKQVRKIGTVGDQGTRVDKFPLARDCRKSCANS